MNKNKFPDEVNEDGFFVVEVGWGGGFYDRDDVDDWFKRCITDYPTGAYRDIDFERVEWFEKWFSQFIEKGEENEE